MENVKEMNEIFFDQLSNVIMEVADVKQSFIIEDFNINLFIESKKKRSLLKL